MARFNWYAFRRDLERIVGRPVSEAEARLVRRRMARHQSLAEAACNRELSAREIAEDTGVERRLKDFFGQALECFNGDPRGATVKLKAWDGCARELTYFEVDWGGNLIFTGGK